MTAAERAALAERNAEIRQWRKDGCTLQQLADKFSISREAVRNVLTPRKRQLSGRPCPQCHQNSRTIRTWPATDEYTKRLHRCQACRHEWLSYQRDHNLLST